MQSKKRMNLAGWLMMLCLSMNALERDSYATGTITCKEVIEKADKALSAKQTQIQVTEQALELSQKETGALKDQVKAKEGQLRSPLRKPVLLLGVGVIGTVVGGPIIAGLGALLLGTLLD